MKRVAFIALVACAPAAKPTPVPAPAPAAATNADCHPAIADYAATTAAQRDCIASAAQRHPEEVAGALITFVATTLEGPLSNRLEAVPADSTTWLSVADAALRHAGGDELPVRVRAARLALELAMRQTRGDDALRAEVWTLRRALARAINDEDAAQTARIALVDAGRRDILVRLGLVRTLARFGDTEAVRALCDTAQDARLTWPCAEADPEGLDRYLLAISMLPALTYRDAAKLATLDNEHHLGGLRCVTDERSGRDLLLPALRARLPMSGQPRSAVIQAAIYHRLHDGAPREVGRCLLGHAAVTCLGLIASHASCPMPYAVADYVVEMDGRELLDFVEFMFSPRFGEIRNWQTGDADTMLLHLHLALANRLVNNRATEIHTLAPYHVVEAARLWKRVGDLQTPFAAMLSPDVVDHVCRDHGRCQQVCGNVLFSPCVFACTAKAQEAKEALCP